MSAKFGARRRNAFLRALAETGNQTISAERAKVSRSWVQLHRSTDPAFDATCREAIEVAKAVLRDDAQSPLTPALSPQGRGGNGPADPKWRYHDGVELVVSGTNGRRIQVRRPKISQWTARVEDRFLAALAATCNVKAACKEAGMSVGAAYAHRHRWPGFARRWDRAVELGMDELELRMLQNAQHFLDPEQPPPDAPMQDMTMTDAFLLLRLYDRRAEKRRKWWRR